MSHESPMIPVSLPADFGVNGDRQPIGKITAVAWRTKLC